VEDVRFRMECVREGVSLGEAGERSGDGGCWGRGLWFSKGRWGLGRRRGGLEEAIRRREEGVVRFDFRWEWIEEVAPALGFEWQISTVKTAS
jgi:hypothetical protein